MNVQRANALDQPLSISAGRQDIALGDSFYDWWLVLDGTPTTSPSWTTYLDSARVTYELMDLKTKLDLIYIQQQARPDDFAVLIGSNPDPNDLHTAGKANGMGMLVYLSVTTPDNTQIDSYLLHAMTVNFPTGSNADVYDLPGPRDWAWTPIDQSDDAARSARTEFGWKDASSSHARYRCLRCVPWNWPTPSSDRSTNYSLSLAGEYLSGDDPDTQQDEMSRPALGLLVTMGAELLYLLLPLHETMVRTCQINNIWRVGLKLEHVADEVADS